LLYDTGSREAALIDVGGPVDSLLAAIDEKGLELKYIFATHCHMDHVEGVPRVKERYPNALIGFNEKEFQDFFEFVEWLEKNMDPAEIDAMKAVPGVSKWFDINPSEFVKPDIFLDDMQVYTLGKHRIRTLLSPGHSAGSICFHAGDFLFSGDVLFYRQVGRTDLLGGSDTAIVESVRRLYEELPDQTRVYPGHGPATDIGSEKEENEEVSMEGVHL
jgi:glyoxylase-like metal-dependent hydrolase (beta-lactamase superfamily II)